jgi:hypothetical protein
VFLTPLAPQVLRRKTKKTAFPHSPDPLLSDHVDPF